MAEPVRTSGGASQPGSAASASCGASQPALAWAGDPAHWKDASPVDLTGLEGLERLTRVARGVRLLRDLPWVDLMLAVYAQARRAAGEALARFAQTWGVIRTVTTLMNTYTGSAPAGSALRSAQQQAPSSRKDAVHRTVDCDAERAHCAILPPAHRLRAVPRIASPNLDASATRCASPGP